VAWLTLAAVISANSIKESLSNLYSHYVPSSDKKPAQGPWEQYVQSDVPVAAGSLGSQIPSAAHMDRGFAFVALPVIRAKFPQYNDLADADLRARLYCKYYEAVRSETPAANDCAWKIRASWSRLRNATALAFGPPLLAVLFGLGFGWVLRGFKAPHSRDAR
jgi:hypothetical protein